MTEQELISTVIDMITEFELDEYRKSDDEEYKGLNKEILQLSIELQGIIKELPQEKAEVIESYIAKLSAIAEKDCRYLYIQGAKDCARSLKKLGII